MSDKTNILDQLKECEKMLPSGEWTFAEMGAVWVGKLKENQNWITRGADKHSYNLFQIESDDLYHLDEEEAKIVAANSMRAIVELRNLLPCLIKTLEEYNAK